MQNPISQQNWAGGELSPNINSRFDLPIYAAGDERMVNFISETGGPKRFRSGFYYAMGTRRFNSAWLLSFQFNDSDAYELEFTENYIRFFRNDGIVTLPAKVITGATKANPCVVTSASHGYTTGDEVIVNGVVGMTELNNRSFVITVLSGNTFSLQDNFGSNINSTAFGTYVSGGGTEKVYEVPSPYLLVDIPGLKIGQNADVLYINHRNYEPRKLTRLANTSWTLALYSRTADPFTDKKTITGVSQANPANVTAVGHGYATGDQVIIETVVGMTQLNGRYFTITVTGADNFTLDGVDSTGYTAYSSAGYASDKKLLPAALAFYQGRLIEGYSDRFPESIWGSLPLDANGDPQYDNFTVGTDPADGFKFTLQPITGKVDRIHSLVPCLNFLAIGTLEGISKADGGSAGDPISPSTISITPVVTDGCLQQVTPILIGPTMLYIHRSALVLFSMEFDIFLNAYNAKDMNMTNEQWTESGITQMVYQVARPTAFWFARNDGIMIGLTFMTKENINGAHRHKIGGVNPKVLSVGIMPRATQYDQNWIVSERTIGGRTVRFVEYATDQPVIPDRDDYWTGDANKATDDRTWRNAMFEAQKEYIHMDAALTYDGSDYGVTAGATLTAGAASGIGVTFTAGAAVFTSDMVGREIWVQAQKGVGSGRALITAYVSSTQVTCKILTSFSILTAIPAGQWYLTTNTVSGIWHLEGQLVSILADGGEAPQATVTNGWVSILYQASVIHVGLPYVGMTRSMALQPPSGAGPVVAKNKNTNDLGIKFLNTLGARYGTDLYRMKDVEFASPSDLTGRPSPLFSGVKRVVVEDDTKYDSHIYIQQIRPLPCKVECLVPFVDVDDE